MAELITQEPTTTDLTEEPTYAERVLDVGMDLGEAYERGKVDINFFASLCIPQVMISALPPFYIACWQLLTSRDPKAVGKILRFALGLPRGHAKTTFIKVIVAWLIVYDKVSFALLVCATDGLAEQLLSDIHDILGSSNIEAIYGPWNVNLSTDRNDLKKAMYHGRPVILAAKGAQSSVRGLNIKHTRPDLIFCDDMQTRENDESPTESAKLRKWFVATLLKLLAPRGDRLVIYVGNMYSDECILQKLAENPGWVSLITGAILENGLPLWPELHSLESLMESFLHDEAMGEADIWFAEVMNMPKNLATSLLPLPLPEYPFAENIIPDGVFITIDPAGFKDVSDDNVIALHYVYDGVGIIKAAITTSLEPEINDPEKLIIRTLRLAIEHGASLIGVEGVGYQSTLRFWLDKYMRLGAVEGIEIVELSPHGRSKESRIRLFIQSLYNKSYFLSNVVRANFIWQATKYKLGAKKNKDDLLDACAYGDDIRNEYWHLVKNNRTISLEFREDAYVVGNNTPF